jgi:hypothetical protein
MRHPTLACCLRCVLSAGAATALLSACAAWTAADAPVATTVPLTAPGDMGRPPWLQRLVATMDAQAYPDGGALRLKLSYELHAAPTRIARRPAARPLPA